MKESDPQTFGSKEYVFNPEFTNQVYNQEEEIQGYKNPEINIHLLGGSLHAFLDIRCKDKSPDADNVEHELKESTFIQGNLELNLTQTFNRIFIKERVLKTT